MPHYRLSILDRGGELIGAVEFDCANDEAALERVEDVLDGHAGELWRLVAVFGPRSPSVQPSHEELVAREHEQKRRTRSH